jgi:hypothetical protein
MPEATIPLSISMLLPQYILFGIADVFTMVGLQEYFYDQMPDTMKTLGIAVFLSVLGVGSFLSSILISVTEKLGCRQGGLLVCKQPEQSTFRLLLLASSISECNQLLHLHVLSQPL